jgi:tetratricopeptide (TPR) repeat protein
MEDGNYAIQAARLVRDPDDLPALVAQYALLAKNLAYGEFYLPLAKRAYEIGPQEITALFNYASALHRAGHFEQALKLYLKGLNGVDPGWWRARFLHHVGIAYRALNENKKACEYYRQAYEASGEIEILKDAAIATMASGDLQTGFKMFEIRKECADKKYEQSGGKLNTQQKLPPHLIHWNGEDLKGKTILVYHEEGQGDFIQFCRYIPRLRDLGAARILLTGPATGLLDLVSRNIAIDGVIELGGPYDCDYVIGSMSIPWRVGIDYSSVSGKPYFSIEAADIPRRATLQVGLVWRGNPDYGMDIHRSMDFTELCPLFDMSGVAFYSLQKDAVDITGFGFDGFIANLDGLMTTWTDTAQLIQALDVVVTVDTAVAHLAGALGKPVFILTTAAADWRWNRNSEKTAWYDSARVIRQKKQGDWALVVANVKDKLRGMIDVRRSAA